MMAALLSPGALLTALLTLGARHEVAAAAAAAGDASLLLLKNAHYNYTLVSRPILCMAKQLLATPVSTASFGFDVYESHRSQSFAWRCTAVASRR
jgi:hypothetical protein